MALSDRLIGGALLAVASFVFVYYTLWAIVTPFFPDDAFIQSYFPPRVWAVRLPALILVVGLSVIGAFVGSVLRKQAIAAKEKEARKGA
ncbi:Dolichol phosphate-mannose biosynthesis regulatory protein [Malassezia cuniculi]|uniref:Dolichol phosphate-mannose biosynthesis regulatory protein n=1 Tax=Malassezia cuniculi TaxID=948313 RepID=A0AAF0ENY8_9BASI|nr:Dolichol phosphate-mannose biosynthesis regulatory protein [Malassezia cuniculi]